MRSYGNLETLIDNDPSEVAPLESPDWTSQKMPQICVVELTQILRRFFEDTNFLKQYFNIRSKLGGNYIFFLSESRIWSDLEQFEKIRFHT